MEAMALVSYNSNLIALFIRQLLLIFFLLLIYFYYYGNNMLAPLLELYNSKYIAILLNHEVTNI